MNKGRIIKALSGFYYIKRNDGEIFQTRPRGIFRKRNESPLVGDNVGFTYETKTEGTLEEIYPRKNELKRPSVANVDVGFIIMSAKDPDFSTSLLDRYLVSLEQYGINPIIYVTKTDIVTESDYTELKKKVLEYEKIGYTVILPNKGKVLSSTEIKEIFGQMADQKLSVFLGQSGAGKSTLLNKIDPSLQLKIGETSKSLGRGKHTTRHVELVELLGGLIADTPGFSAIQFEELTIYELPECFPEIWETGKNCRFNGCLHKNEPNCSVKMAVDTGDIARFRYDNYLSIMSEIEKRKPKYGKKKGEK